MRNRAARGLRGKAIGKEGCAAPLYMRATAAVCREKKRCPPCELRVRSSRVAPAIAPNGLVDKLAWRPRPCLLYTSDAADDM
eukprot:12470516-Alexandrium_andersonii.AAC.1